MPRIGRMVADSMDPQGVDVFRVLGYVPHERQRAFHAAVEDETLYGGSRGGGKTRALVMEAVRLAVAYPGIRILLCRPSFPQLRATVVSELAKTGFAKRLGGRWNASDYTLRFGNGSQIVCGYVDSASDLTQYQGVEFEAILIDEVALLPPESLPILRECLRGSNTAIPIRWLRMTGNPGGVGHAATKTEFIDSTENGAKIVTDPDSGRTRRFIPATVYDNLEHIGKGYLGILLAIKDPARRAAMLHGNWDSFQGQVFEKWDHDRHVVPRTTLPPQWQRWCGIDYGRRDPWAVLWFAVDSDRRLWLYRECYETGVGVRDQARRILALEREAGEEYVRHAIDPSTANHLTDGLSIYEEYAQEGLPCILADNDRLAGWAKLHDALADGPICRVHEYLREQGKWHQDTCPMLHVLDGTCPNLVRTLPALPYDKTRVEDVDTKAEDHACLVADTLVHTDRGLIPIEHVVVGDRALTREGYRQVSNAAMTDSAAEVGSVTFADGTVLIGTANHPVFTSRGLVSLGDLAKGDVSCLPAEIAVAGPWSAIGTAPVFNLTVEGPHEFFANGVLVSNCDALRYALQMMGGVGSPFARDMSFGPTPESAPHDQHAERPLRRPRYLVPLEGDRPGSTQKSPFTP